jgi:hypothetical protein
MTKDHQESGSLAPPEAPLPKTDTLDPATEELELTDLELALEPEGKAPERLSPTERIVLDEIPGCAGGC